MLRSGSDSYTGTLLFLFVFCYASIAMFFTLCLIPVIVMLFFLFISYEAPDKYFFFSHQKPVVIQKKHLVQHTSFPYKVTTSL